MRKFTIAEIKKTALKRCSNTGLILFKGNQYWANSDQIDFINDELQSIIELNEGVTTKQIEKLNRWVTDLKQTYLFD